jgi:hypothetical protein
MIYLYKTNGVITVGEDDKVPVTYYGRGGKSGKFYPSGTLLGYAKTTSRVTAQPLIPAGSYTLYPTILNGLAKSVKTKTSPFSNTFGNYQNISANTTTGIGSGVSFNFSIYQQGVFNLTIVNPGADYKVGDTVTIDAATIDGSEDLVMEISSIYSYDTLGSGIAFYTFSPGAYYPPINITNTGSGYRVGDILTFNGEDVGGAAGTTFALKISSLEYDGFLINIGGDNYQAAWENLVIDGTSPTSFSDANDLLLNLFS